MDKSITVSIPYGKGKDDDTHEFPQSLVYQFPMAKVK